jgi:hypothetical protein
MNFLPRLAMNCDSPDQIARLTGVSHYTQPLIHFSFHMFNGNVFMSLDFIDDTPWRITNCRNFEITKAQNSKKFESSETHSQLRIAKQCSAFLFQLS